MENHSRRVVVGYKPKYVHEVLVNCLFKLAQEKSVVRRTDRPIMTIAVDSGRKATKQTNKHLFYIGLYRENYGKIFLSETIRLRTLICGM